MPCCCLGSFLCSLPTSPAFRERKERFSGDFSQARLSRSRAPSQGTAPGTGWTTQPIPAKTGAPESCPGGEDMAPNIHRPVAAALWMVGSLAGVSAIAVSGRGIGAELDAFGMRLYRSLTALLDVG